MRIGHEHFPQYTLLAGPAERQSGEEVAPSILFTENESNNGEPVSSSFLRAPLFFSLLTIVSSASLSPPPREQFSCSVRVPPTTHPSPRMPSTASSSTGKRTL